MIKSRSKSIMLSVWQTWAPPPSVTVSEWADKYRKLSPEASSSPGQWRTVDYQKAVLDAVTDPEIEKVVLMWSSQVGKTELELNIAGYYMHQDPSPIMVVLPTKDPLAKDWSRDRLAPMIRDTEVLAGKVSDPKMRDGENSTLHKKFPGGLIVITGANVAADLSSRPMRILLCDEVDRFPASAGTEGDPIALAEKRQITFWNFKRIYVSTPTVEGASRIEVDYKKGTQEKWKKECPHCGAFVFFDIHGMKFDYTKDEHANYTVSNINFQCPACLELFDERTWKQQPGEWVPDNPNIKGTRSFHLNAFSSPWYKWERIVKEWLESKKDPQKLKVVVNTLFGLPWKEKLDIDSEDKFLERREPYEAELPEGVLLLTCGVDTQDDRLEYEIVGWGRENESWGIGYGVVLGKPNDKETWITLDDKLSKIYKFADNKGIKIACTCIDSGGHFTTDVYKFTKKNEHRRIISVKGMGGPSLPLIHKLSRNNKENAMVAILGVDEGKTSIISALKVRDIGPRYCHYPDDENRGYDRNYFKGLLSERQVLIKKNGIAQYTWQKIAEHARNEAFDTRNYAQAALQLLKPDFDAIEKRLKSMPAGQSADISSQTQTKKRTGCVKKGIDA